MDTWLKVAGIVLSPLFAIFLALVMKRPRVCIRIAQYIGGLSVSGAMGGFMVAVGMYLARQAVLAQGAKTYAISTELGSDDPWVLDQLAGAIDPMWSLVVGTTVLLSAVAAICVAAIIVSRMVLEDERADGPQSQSKAADHAANSSEPAEGGSGPG